MTEHGYLVSADRIAMWAAIRDRVSEDACRRFVLECRRLCKRAFDNRPHPIHGNWKLNADCWASDASIFSEGDFKLEDRPALIREAFGNPWQPLSAIQHAVTPTIRERAIGIRDHDDWDELPLLADELEEAGCQAVGLLRHLRGLTKICQWCGGRGETIVSVYGYPAENERCDRCKGIGHYPVDPHSRACWALAVVIGEEDE